MDICIVGDIIHHSATKIPMSIVPRLQLHKFQVAFEEFGWRAHDIDRKTKVKAPAESGGETGTDRG